MIQKKDNNRLKGSIIGNLVSILSGLSLAGVTVSLRMQKMVQELKLQYLVICLHFLY